MEAELRCGPPSARTIESLLDGTRQFSAFLREKGMPTDVTTIAREHVEAFVVYIRDSRSASTAETRFRALRLFFRWLEDEGEIERSPMYRMSSPRVPEVPVDVPTTADLQGLLAACSTNDDARYQSWIERHREYLAERRAARGTERGTPSGRRAELALPHPEHLF